MVQADQSTASRSLGGATGTTCRRAPERESNQCTLSTPLLPSSPPSLSFPFLFQFLLYPLSFSTPLPPPSKSLNLSCYVYIYLFRFQVRLFHLLNVPKIAMGDPYGGGVSVCVSLCAIVCECVCVCVCVDSSVERESFWDDAEEGEGLKESPCPQLTSPHSPTQNKCSERL